MPSLLLVCFLLQLAIHLINTVGASTITALAWYLYSRLPTSTSQKARQAVQLRNEVVRLKRELNATSAQDEFSKWAKLRRQHDKTITEHDKVSKEVQAFKSQFDTAVGILRWLATKGVMFFLQTWFQRVPMFWLPKGLAPYYVEWILSFPRAPVGAISIQVWTGACAAIIDVVGAAITSTWVLVHNGGVKTTEPVRAKVQVEEKKEL